EWDVQPGCGEPGGGVGLVCAVLVDRGGAGECGAGGLRGGERIYGSVCALSQPTGGGGRAARADASDQLAVVGGGRHEDRCGAGGVVATEDGDAAHVDGDGDCHVLSQSGINL